jgi:hypothetical protein
MVFNPQCRNRIVCRLYTKCNFTETRVGKRRMSLLVNSFRQLSCIPVIVSSPHFTLPTFSTSHFFHFSSLKSVLYKESVSKNIICGLCSQFPRCMQLLLGGKVRSSKTDCVRSAEEVLGPWPTQIIPSLDIKQ